MSGRPLAVFDLDGTITRHDTLAPFVLDLLGRRPWRLWRLGMLLVPAVRFLADRDRGALKGALIHATLGGLPRSSLEAAADRLVRRLRGGGLYREALAAMAEHRARGERLVLMSASTDLYVPKIAGSLGFDEVLCTRVHWREDGRLDGRLVSPNCRGEQKRRVLRELIAREAPARVCAYGNSRADLPHLRLAQEAYWINAPRRGLRELGPEEARIRPLRWRERC